MPSKPVADHLLQQAVNEYYKLRSYTEAAKVVGIPLNTFRSRHTQAVAKGFVPNEDIVPKEEGVIFELSEARNKIRQLETSISAQAKEDFNAEFSKRKIVKLMDSDVSIPEWVIRKPKGHNVTGIPLY